MEDTVETTNPETEVVSPEARLEALFSKESGKPQEEKQAEPEAEAETAEVETDQPAAEAEPEEEAPEEIEFEGKQYAVPKELKDAFLKKKDYTTKTQELADQRRLVQERETQLQEQEKVRAAIFEKAVGLNALEQRVKAFSGVDWAGLADQNPTEYLKLDRAYRELQQQHAQARDDVQAAIANEQRTSAELRQQTLAKANEQLAQEIKGWGPDLGKKLLEGGKAYGFTETELAAITDPRRVREMHDAYQWRQLQASKTLVAKKVENVKPVTVKAARTAQTTQANADTDAARQRLAKSGKPRDAEDVLTRIFAKRMK